MAGNEDPVDIQSLMLPTLSYDLTPSILQKTDVTFTHDIIYGQLLTNLQDVFYNVLGFIIAKQKGGLLSQTQYTNALPNIDSLKTIKDMLGKIDKEIVDLEKLKEMKKKETIPSEQKQKLITIYSTQLDKLYEKLTSLNIKNLMQLQYVRYDVKTEQSHETGYQWELTFTINKDLIHDIIKSSIQKLLDKLESQLITKSKKGEQKDSELNYLKKLKPNLATVKNEIIQAQAAKGSTDKDRLSIVMLKYISDNIDSIQLQNNVFRMILRLKEKGSSFNYYINNDLGKKDFNDKIKNALLSFFKAQPYIFVPPTTKDEIHLQYSHETITTIIQEGYFINQANAELIHYFEQKRIGKQTTPKKVKVANKYTFEEKFALSEYNKFKRVTESQHYETGLVPTIYEMFGGNSLDVMFACLLDENDVGKVKGAIDTLYLVRDIKST
jgi:hypothetical protein